VKKYFVVFYHHVVLVPISDTHHLRSLEEGRGEGEGKAERREKKMRKEGRGGRRGEEERRERRKEGRRKEGRGGRRGEEEGGERRKEGRGGGESIPNKQQSSLPWSRGKRSSLVPKSEFHGGRADCSNFSICTARRERIPSRIPGYPCPGPSE
jgi:hypothetical protein